MANRTLLAISLFSLLVFLNEPVLFPADDPEVLFQKAESLLQQEEYSEALQVFEKLVSTNLSYTQAYRGLVECYNALGDPQGAAIYMESLLLENPTSAEVSYGLGCAFYSMKRFGEANTYFENAIKLNPELAEAWNNSGAIYHFVFRDYEKARRYYEKAIILSERSENERVLEVAKKNLSNLPLPKPKLEPVTEHLTLEEFITRFLACVEENDEERMRELVLGQKENSEQAVEWFLTQAMESVAHGTAEDEKTMLQLAKLLEKECRETHENVSLKQRIALYQSLTDEEKKAIVRGEKLIAEGLRFEEQGLFEKAQLSYNEARLSFEQSHDESRLGLAFLYEGDAYRKMKTYSQARKAYGNALTCFAKTGPEKQKALTLSSLGITYYHLGEYSNAFDSLKQAAQIYKTLEDKESEEKVSKNIELIKDKIRTEKEVGYE